MHRIFPGSGSLKPCTFNQKRLIGPGGADRTAVGAEDAHGSRAGRHHRTKRKREVRPVDVRFPSAVR